MTFLARFVPLARESLPVKIGCLQPQSHPNLSDLTCSETSSPPWNGTHRNGAPREIVFSETSSSHYNCVHHDLCYVHRVKRSLDALKNEHEAAIIVLRLNNIAERPTIPFQRRQRLISLLRLESSVRHQPCTSVRMYSVEEAILLFQLANARQNSAWTIQSFPSHQRSLWLFSYIFHDVRTSMFELLRSNSISKSIPAFPIFFSIFRLRILVRVPIRLSFD